MALIAVVDGNEATRQRTCRSLRSGDLEVLESSDGLEALRNAFSARPDAAIVDLNASGIDGYELIRVLRAACEIPIIASAEGATPEQVVRALDAGADDAVDKECSVTELIARVRAAIRRHEKRRIDADDAKEVRTGGLVIDRIAQTVTKHGEPLQLTRTEYRLLDALASRLGQVAPRRFLLGTVWGEEYVDDTHYLRVYVGYLRAKLEDDPSQPRYIINEWGTGYRLALLPIEERVASEQAEQPAEQVLVEA